MNKRPPAVAAALLLLLGVSTLWGEPPSLETDKSVDPTVIYLQGGGSPDEASVALTVTAVGDPQTQTGPADVVLIMDRSGSMAGQKMIDAKAAAIYFCSLLDIGTPGGVVDKSSLVSFNSSATLDRELTREHYLTMIAIDSLVAAGGTAIGYGIMMAKQELISPRHREEAYPVMILLTDGDHNSGPDPVPVADSAKAEGITIYAIGLGLGVNEYLLRQIASDPDSEYYYYTPSSEDLDSIYARVHEHMLLLAARGAVATEILAQNIHYVPNSFSIDPISVSGDTAVWNLGNFNIGDSWSVSFNITASDTGYLPVDEYPSAEVTYFDYLGHPGSEPFPQRYITVLAPTGVAEDIGGTGVETAFLQVGPNPFSSFSVIHYSVSRPAWVTLDIYNLAGELVRSLVAELKPAGAHTVDWDSRDDLGAEVPSGIYLLRLEAGNLSTTHKVVLLR